MRYAVTTAEGYGDTRRASFRLGAETESQLDELAQEAGSSQTEVVRSLISARHAELRVAEDRAKDSKTSGADPSQMLLDDILSHEVVRYE